MYMDYKGRAQCLVIRDHKMLMVKHRVDGVEYFCTPGGGIEMGETPEQAAIRELKEECCVTGTIIKKTCEHADIQHSSRKYYSFQIDIGEQQPQLGYDPELIEHPILVGVQWLLLNEISERDRAFLLASGLWSIKEFSDELSSWGDDISYPNKRNK